MLNEFIETLKQNPSAARHFVYRIIEEKILSDGVLNDPLVREQTLKDIYKNVVTEKFTLDAVVGFALKQYFDKIVCASQQPAKDIEENPVEEIRQKYLKHEWAAVKEEEWDGQDLFITEKKPNDNPEAISTTENGEPPANDTRTEYVIYEKKKDENDLNRSCESPVDFHQKNHDTDLNEMVENILFLRGNTIAKDSSGNYPSELIQAIIIGDLEGVQSIVRENPFSAETDRYEGLSPIVYAILFGDPDTINTLLSVSPNRDGERAGIPDGPSISMNRVYQIPHKTGCADRFTIRDIIHKGYLKDMGDDDMKAVINALYRYAEKTNQGPLSSCIRQWEDGTFAGNFNPITGVLKSPGAPHS